MLSACHTKELLMVLTTGCQHDYTKIVRKKRVLYSIEEPIA